MAMNVTPITALRCSHGARASGNSVQLPPIYVNLAKANRQLEGERNFQRKAERGKRASSACSVAKAVAKVWIKERERERERESQDPKMREIDVIDNFSYLIR